MLLEYILVTFDNQIVDWKMFTNEMQVHHGGAGTTAMGLRAGVNAFFFFQIVYYDNVLLTSCENDPSK